QSRRLTTSLALDSLVPAAAGRRSTPPPDPPSPPPPGPPSAPGPRRPLARSPPPPPGRRSTPPPGGYLKRQAIFSCLTCVPGGVAGVCTACSLACHDSHEVSRVTLPIH